VRFLLRRGKGHDDVRTALRRFFNGLRRLTHLPPIWEKSALIPIYHLPLAVDCGALVGLRAWELTNPTEADAKNSASLPRRASPAAGVSGLHR
jgi:hypothetical protein